MVVGRGSDFHGFDDRSFGDRERAATALSLDEGVLGSRRERV